MKSKEEIEEYLKQHCPEMLEWAKMVSKRSRKLW